MNEVVYLLDVFPETTFRKTPVPRRGMMQLAPGQGQDGYGRKISSDYMAFFNNRWHRVYCCCISNSGSLYVPIKGKWHFIRDYDVPDEVRK